MEVQGSDSDWRSPQFRQKVVFGVAGATGSWSSITGPHSRSQTHSHIRSYCTCF
uniref:Uncharacterized protein n=1 Tax=Neogobius melanostomus TaxID=47308 RepID=A0A8C6U2G8_9GOBI